MGRLVIYGNGGFGREVVTAARGSSRQLAFLTDGDAIRFAGVPTISLAELRPDDETVIAVADPTVRRRLAGRIGQVATVIAPTVVIGPDVEIDDGAIFCDHAMVTASARIGRHFHCNVYSYVAHDCVIGDYVTFAPKVACNGNIHIGDMAYIGTGAVMRQGTPDRPLRIGEGAIVGMGAVVTRDVAPYTTVAGNPARAIPRVRPIDQAA